MTGLDMRLRTTLGEAETVGKSDDAQVSFTLFVLILRLTGGLESKSAWPLSGKSAPIDPIVISSGDNFGEFQILGSIIHLTHLCRRRCTGRYLA